MAVTTFPTSDPTSETRATPIWRTGARAGVLAALATTALAGAALAADVPLEVDGEQIPLAGFAQLTLVCAVLGIVLAKAIGRWASRPQHTFTATTVALTAVSFVPDLVVPASGATRLALIATHVVAAAIVIPALRGRLPERA